MAVTFLYYIPYGILATVAFIATNLVLVPVAYVVAILSKFKFLRLKASL